MKKFLAVLLTAFLSIGAVKPASSIRPLQVMNDKGELSPNFCTVWQTTSNERRVWMTAFHCVADGEGKPYFGDYVIGGKHARLVAFDPQHDLAALAGGPSDKPLTVSLSSPELGQEVWSMGFPYKNFIYVDGHVSGLNIEDSDYLIDNPLRFYTQYQIPVGHGSSGSPVIDKKSGTVVGIINTTECWELGRGFCPVGGGRPLSEIRAFLYGE